MGLDRLVVAMMQRASDAELVAMFSRPEHSHYAKRFHAMGFRIMNVEVMGDLNLEGLSPPPNVTYPILPWDPDYVAFRIKMVCVCGRVELGMFRVSWEGVQMGAINVFDEIHRSGATSRQHLLADGYTVSQVDEMERKADEAEVAELPVERRASRLQELERYRLLVRERELEKATQGHCNMDTTLLEELWAVKKKLYEMCRVA